MKRLILLALLSILPGLLIAQPISPDTTDRPLLLKNARIVDPSAQIVREGALLIRGERIAEVREAAPADFAGRTLDLEGQWVIPGLHDMHVHSYGNMGPNNQAMQFLQTSGTARRMLYAGVTDFLDLAAPEDYILNLRDKQRNGDGVPGADIFAAGPIFTAPNGHGTEYGAPNMARTVTNPEDARQQVAKVAQQSPDAIKLVYNPENERFPSIDRATMEAIIAEAQDHDLKTIAHIETWDAALATVEAGVSAITHAAPAPVPDALVAAMQQRGTVWIPTLAVHTELAHIARHPASMQDSLLTAVASSDLISAYRDTSAFADWATRWMQEQRRTRDAIFQAVATLHEAGIPILTGTDAGNPGLFQGYSLHRELVLLTEAGLSPWDVLRATTTRAGDFLGRSIGVQPGDLANLVVLEASPIEDIRHTQRIRRVIHHGQVIDRDALLQDSSSQTFLPSNN